MLQRRKADAILLDLNDTVDLSLCTSLPQINSTAKTIGAMYVLEGSTLGGRGISKMLQRHAFINPDNLHFFMATLIRPG
ncbi:MAG: hypothetical protein C4329_07220 [Chitinophagaceae bacterium]|mgnify:CR=1 FL=1